MSENAICGISLQSASLNANNLAFAEKLRKFGYAVVLDEIGNDMLSKAVIGIYDAIAGSPKPHILIVTTEKLKYNWYSELITSLGADFKFVSSFATMGVLSRLMPNLYIMGEKDLDDTESSFMIDMEREGLVWDLIIIDCGLSRSGITPSKYIENLKCKTKKLIIFAESLKNDIKSLDILRAVPRALMNEYKEGDFDISPDIVNFNLNTPYMRYYNENEFDTHELKITNIDYTLDKEINAQHDDLQKLPAYKYGANIFEELTLEHRKQYILPRYNDDITNVICEADTKLDAFLIKIKELLSDEKNCIAVYFGTKNTMEYIEKVLAAKVPKAKNNVAVIKNDVCNISETLSAFSGTRNQPPRIILCDDGLPEKIKNVEKITHIINYELPQTPTLLGQRFRRTGRTALENASPEFIVFSDTGSRFDGRIINSVLALNFLDAVLSEIPSKNIFIHFPCAADAITKVISELYKAQQLPDDDDAKAYIFKFLLKYSLTKKDYPEFIQFVTEKLNDFKTAFEITFLSDENTIKKSVSAKLDEMMNAFSYLDENGVIRTVKSSGGENAEYKAFSESLKENSYILQLEKAEKEIDKRITDGNDYEFFSDLIDGLENEIRSAVLLNIWRYWNEATDIKEDYREFIKLVNEGVI